tara:strand:+ start:991 stop:1284 length:294 start_codon:yes stop_codon:yes gene_type:complete
MNMNKSQILLRAAELVNGGRQETHGDTKTNHEQIAEFWNIFLDGKLQPSAAITSDEVAIMMTLLKISRSQRGKDNVDDYVDAAAYMAIAGELKHGSI